MNANVCSNTGHSENIQSVMNSPTEFFFSGTCCWDMICFKADCLFLNEEREREAEKEREKQKKRERRITRIHVEFFWSRFPSRCQAHSGVRVEIDVTALQSRPQSGPPTTNHHLKHIVGNLITSSTLASRSLFLISSPQPRYKVFPHLANGQWSESRGRGLIYPWHRRGRLHGNISTNNSKYLRPPSPPSTPLQPR